MLKGAIMATDHLKKCVQHLTQDMHIRYDNNDVVAFEEAFVAAFELIDQPWDFTGDKDVLIWREGYEQCMQDIVDAIADEWGVALPVDPTRSQENHHGGEGQ